MNILALMRASAINDHNDMITRVTTGHLIDANLHAIAVDMRQYQAVEGSIEGTDCTESISNVSSG
ncbi:hypothetical protein SAMN05421863_102117 [Nitrosomonas communis]|uniref:Uncharacterized protein n=1 Tax=Nitrosomonas communis TaxID=44574 RepID=A0A1I4PM31_9PROT|nr:hypothetical protein SAMN05421863_102117 [Nitrosomonas communis]